MSTPSQAATPAHEAIVVEELGRDRFDALAARWDALVERANPDAYYARHGFLRIWLDNFEPDAKLRVFVARQGDALLAALPLVEDKGRVAGLPVRRLRSPSNDHSNRFDLLCAKDHPEALEALWAHVKAAGGFDVLELRDVPEGGFGYGLLALAARDGFPTGTWDSLKTPYIPLGESFDAVMKRVDSKFKANVRRRRRKLEEKGKVELKRVTGGPDLEEWLELGFQLEASGWKGRGGTAIANDQQTRGFYAEWARHLAQRGELECWFLMLDGEPVGFHYGLVTNGAYYLPKMAYAEEHAECSPGQLVLQAVLEECCQASRKELDFLGPSMPWKRDWTDRERVHQYLYVFSNDGRGRALRDVKFTWLPKAKEVLGWKR